MLLEVSHLVKSFGTDVVLSHVELTLAPAETLSILGKSGCGKTTLLKIIAGLVPADAGSLRLRGEPLDLLPASKRNIVYISQEPLLFPHLSVFENIAFGLRIRKLDKADVRAQVDQLAASLGLSDKLRSMPNELSGGQKQRVSFGRALIIQPQVLLLDEPFGSLDSHTRAEMQALFGQISREQQISSIFVTHDLKEAILIGDRIALMEKGMLKSYPDKNSFISDAGTGVQREMDFWKSLSL